MCPANIEYTTTGNVQVVLKGAKSKKVYYPASSSTGCATGAVREELQAVLVSLHITFLHFVEGHQAARYQELWQKYKLEQGMTEATNLRQWWSQLQSWRTWGRGAADRLHLREMDVHMTSGPHTAMDTYNRADIGGVSFRAKQLDIKWDSTNSYFLPKSYDGNQSARDFFVWVGQFQTFIEVVPPWYYSEDPQATVMRFGVVKWCEAPSPAMLPLSDLPLIVKGEFLPISEENGYKYAVWDVTNVVPTNVAIVGLDEHFQLGRTVHRRRAISWKKVQAAIPADWHWLPGYCAAHGFCAACSEVDPQDGQQAGQG